ncbi:Carbohydrate family 9 binding domain-like [Muriicola jejuensis]|uniref:Sugar-binding protein n=1 Tax=Muriicola jejuensis TaxID=504488 RepID=A0A6P0UKM2_9FLAO|nr:sugar-binding protein [Muriicola jejuensis]NER10776.1 sugar-binding protein [Muriicola jejuensis]SMP16296.1 Carbohydrate family 9 binding domain-like [Muriicola jejuensis]
MKYAMMLLAVACCLSCGTSHEKEDHQVLVVKKTTTAPTLDGLVTENCWNMATWHPLDQNWLGEAYSYEDFNGRYKLTWDEDYLYLLVEITDDILYDARKDPLKLWWDDDCVEVFIDEDNSGGLHQFSHNAFAYHIALDGNVVDLAPDREPRLYNDHIRSARRVDGTLSTWELAIRLFRDDYQDGGINVPVPLKKDKKVGFALAYCDNDGSAERENFIGSVFVPGEDKNQGWINADIFGTLVLEE